MSSLFRAADAPKRILERVRTLAPELSISPRVDDRTSNGQTDDEQARALELEGFATLRAAVPEPRAAALAGGIGRLVANGLPATFAYLFDDTWQIGEAVRARLSAILERPYVLTEDGWSWQVEPGQDGWSAHRDDYRILDRTAPERINVWVALTDTPLERSCIHVVPLSEDANYPNTLERSEAPSAVTRQLPVSAGTALVWNANLLHWGGRCATEATGPRVAISFTLVRADAAEEIALPLVTLDQLSPERRVDAIASMIARYEHKPISDVSVDVHAWAKATCALRAVLARIPPNASGE